MVPWHEIDRDTPFGNTVKGFECHPDEFRTHFTPEQEISSVNHKIDASVHGGFKRPLEIPKEVRPPSPPFDPRPGREVETQMRIS